MINNNKLSFFTFSTLALSLFFSFITFFPNSASAQNTPAIIWPEIKAQSAYVYDPIGNVVLFAKDADTQRPLASLVKIMTAGVADNLLRTSPALASKPVKIGVFKDHNRADKALKAGNIWPSGELIKYMLIGSSNKAAEVLASEMIPRSSFISLMNFDAKRFGLTKTVFNSPSGVNISTLVKKKTVESAGGVSTAREFATLLWKVVEEHAGLLEITQLKSGLFLNAVSHDILAVENTNKILKDLPIVVGKTGFTELAGGNLAVILQKTPSSHAYVIVVLGSTEEDRFSDVAALASTTLQLVGER